MFSNQRPISVTIWTASTRATTPGKRRRARSRSNPAAGSGEEGIGTAVGLCLAGFIAMLLSPYTHRDRDDAIE